MLVPFFAMDRIHSQVYHPKMLCQVFIKGWPRQLVAVCNAQIQVDLSESASNVLVLTILITLTSYLLEIFVLIKNLF